MEIWNKDKCISNRKECKLLRKKNKYMNECVKKKIRIRINNKCNLKEKKGKKGKKGSYM